MSLIKILEDMMKKIVLPIILALLISAVAISGCIDSDTSNKGYTVKMNDFKELEDFNDDLAAFYISPDSTDPSLGLKVTDSGTTTINEIKVYYCNYTDFNNNKEVRGEIYYQKDNRWHSIIWADIPGNPNKATIDREVEKLIQGT